MKYVCDICGYVYNSDVEVDKRMDKCPQCGTPFKKYIGMVATSDIALRKVGHNKVAVIDAIRKVTKLGLKEAKDIIDKVECGQEYIIHDVSRENVITIIEIFTNAGAIAIPVKGLGDMDDFESAMKDISETDSFVDNKNLIDEDIDSKQILTVESIEKQSEIFKPIVLADNITKLDRQGIMNVLIEVGKIAKESEEYDIEVAELSRKINNEQKKADNIRKHVSDRAQKIIWGFTITAAVIGTFIVPVIMTIVFGVIALIIMNATVKKADLKKHEEENNINADEYIKEYIYPMRTRLDEVYALRDNLINGGKRDWAIDIVGKDMFYSECIKDLYNLIKSRRADSLKEALNKYDDEQHKAHMEEMQRAIQNASEVTAEESVKHTAYAKETAKSAHQAATAARATAYHTRQINKNTRRFRQK